MATKPYPFIPECITTDHCRRRMAQRCLTEDLLVIAECYGRRARYQPGGVDVWRVDRRTLRALGGIAPAIANAMGVTSVNSATGVCITAYRNRVGERLLRKAIRPGRGRRAWQKGA